MLQHDQTDRPLNLDDAEADLPLEVVARLLVEWREIWSRAQRVQQEFPDDVRPVATQGARGQESLLKLVPMLASLPPEVITTVRSDLDAAIQSVSAANQGGGRVAGQQEAEVTARWAEGAEPIRVSVIGSSRVVTRGLKVLLGFLSPIPIEVTGTLDGNADVHAACLRSRPQVAVVALEDDHETIELVHSVTRDFPGIAVVVVSNCDQDGVLQLLRTGAKAVMVSGTSTRALVSAVAAAAAGWCLLPRQLARELLDSYAAAGRVLNDLTADQLALWRDIACGMSDSAIARRDHLSLRTVRRRVAALYRRIEADNRVHAAALAGRYGIVATEHDVAEPHPS